MDYYLKTRKSPPKTDMVQFRADIMDSGDKFIIRCELAGYAKDEIDIIATNDKITVTATKSHCEKEENEKYVHRESVFNEKSRIFYMGDIDINKITADYTDGLLSIYLPKIVNENNGRKIEF